MSRQGASGLKDLARVASGLALVFNELLLTLPAIRKLNEVNFVGSTTTTLNFVRNTISDLTGRTHPSPHIHPSSPPSENILHVTSSSQFHPATLLQRDTLETRPLKPQTTGLIGSQPARCTDQAHPLRPTEEITADTGLTLQEELHRATCVSGRDKFSVAGVASLDSARVLVLDPPNEFRNSESVQTSEKALGVLKEALDEKMVSPLKDPEGTTGRLLGNKSETIGTRPRKKLRSRERRVPSTPLGRVLGFAGLGAGLAWGSLQESAKRLWGGQGSTTPPGQSILSPFVTEQNAERIALALCRMRGAALKIGQMLSIQDESLVPAPVLAALETVRQGADMMPQKQLFKVLDKELGPGWRERLSSFDEEPIAAASIGQVHRAVLKDGREVAMKVQYPGVAASINSDIENVRLLLEYTNLLPEGLYLDEAMRVAKEELERECNYCHEAISQKRFKKFLASERGLYVPLVIDELSTRGVLTSELLPGVPIDKVAKMDQKVRNEVGARLLSLTLRELFVFRFMQTDPNWGNFLFDESTNTINLIDFGAARDFPQQFVDDYLQMVLACANRDREKVIEMSIRLGFLTGKETQVMLDAHIEAAYITGEPFSRSEAYDFHKSDLPRRISVLGATMLKYRLTPPPPEAYSLHRKLSGAFLACVKLSAVVPCHEILQQICENYRSAERGEDTNTIKEASA